MELFNYENLTFFAKYSHEIWIGGLILAGLMLFISLIVSFCKENNSEGVVAGLRVIVRLALSAAVVIGIVVAFSFLRTRHEKINETYLRYKEAYETGECRVIRGKVEEFSPATNSKSFTLDGVRFTVYSSSVVNEHRGPGEDSPVIYYTYNEASHQTIFQPGEGSMNANTVYLPEDCVILGDNQRLEIHYIEEYGQNRILYIKEISE